MLLQTASEAGVTSGEREMWGRAHSRTLRAERPGGLVLACEMCAQPGLSGTILWHSEGITGIDPDSALVPLAMPGVNLGDASVVMVQHGPGQYDYPLPGLGHSHGVFRLVVVAKGVMEVFAPTQSVLLTPSAAILLDGSAAHRHTYATSAPVAYFIVDLHVAHPVIGGSIPRTGRPLSPPGLLAAFSAFMVQLSAGVGGIAKLRDEPGLVTLVEESILALVRGIIEYSRRVLGEGTAGPRDAVISYVHRNCTDKDLNLVSVADALGTSTRTVQRLMGTGPTLSELIRIYRVEVALDLLAAPEGATLGDAASGAGFSSIRALRRAVQRVKGVTMARTNAARTSRFIDRATG